MFNNKELVYLQSIISSISAIPLTLGDSSWEKEWKEKIGLTDNQDDILKKVSKHPISVTKDRRLVSITELVKNDSPSRARIPLAPLSLSKDEAFPKEQPKENWTLEKLWSRMDTNIRLLQANDKTAFAENLLDILFRFASSIPASEEENDVSLFDKAKTTAAQAVCLEQWKAEGNAKEDEFLLIGADFSGIQTYIYQIVSKYAGKNLKGRSFYIKLLADAVARHILRETGLFRANIIYNSGGCFYILAPNTQPLREKLTEVFANIEDHILKAHGTSIYVAISYVSMSQKVLNGEDNQRQLPDVWNELFSKRDKLKYARYSGIISQQYDRFFEPKAVDGSKKDAITGEDFLKGEKPVSFNNDQFISLLNNLQIKMGKALKECEVMLAVSSKLPELDNKIHITPADLGTTYYFLQNKDVRQNVDVIAHQGKNAQLVFFNDMHEDTDYLLDSAMTGCVCSTEFYGGNSFNERTLEEMCENDGFSRMGVLRMDVDNLGSIFQSGISREKASLERYAALSRTLDYFFSGYLNTICQEIDSKRNFIIYSGGDDVFIIGSWDTMISIANRIQEDFKEYTCHNKAFSISGGVAIVGAKFPIIQGAEESANEESNAKNHLCGSSSKNSISFMDMALNWDNEFKAVLELKNQLCNLLRKMQLNKAFISKILMNWANADIRQHKIRNVKVFWMLTYDINRLKERKRKDSTDVPEANILIKNCLSEICEGKRNSLNGHAIQTDYHPLELWAFACRWAELETRAME